MEAHRLGTSPQLRQPRAVGDRVDQPLPWKKTRFDPAGTRRMIRKSDSPAAIRNSSSVARKKLQTKLSPSQLCATGPRLSLGGRPRSSRRSCVQDGQRSGRRLCAARVTDDDKGEGHRLPSAIACGPAAGLACSRKSRLRTFKLWSCSANIQPEQIDRTSSIWALAWSRATDFATAVGVVDATIGQTDRPGDQKAARAGENYAGTALITSCRPSRAWRLLPAVADGFVLISASGPDG